MAQSISFNGLVYTIPDTGETDWGENLTNFFVAIPQGALQKTGGTFTLTADVNFGPNYGVLAAYLKSRGANPATIGLVRLTKTDAIVWRNQANSGNLQLTIDSSNNLTWDGVKLVRSGEIVNADVAANAAIARSKLASGTNYRILANNSTGVMSENAALSAANVVYADTNGQLAGEATLAKTRGGSGQDNSSITFPASGVLVTEAGTETLTNKSMSGGSNTFTNISLTTAVTGILPNANTTAASANTASAIVARDSSGNFSAGTITAALTGNAATATAPASGTARGAVTLNASGNFTSVAPSTSGNVMTSDGTDWISSPASSANASELLQNLGLSVTASAGTMTIALKQADASTDPVAGSGAVVAGFRNATSATGAYNLVSVTGALSMTLAGATTLGAASGVAQYVYVYLFNNAGAVTLGASLNAYDEGALQSSSTTTTSNSVIYQASALSSKPVRLIGRFLATNTASSWASPTEVSIQPFEKKPVTMQASGATTGGSGAASIIICGTTTFDTNAGYNASTGRYTVSEAGYFLVQAYLNGSNSVLVSLYKNGSIGNPVCVTSSGPGLGWGSTLVSCAAGDILDLRTSASIGGWGGGSYWSVMKIN